ncbi:MAG: hypothetical protein ACI3YT_04200 [Prevotella sp.]
MRPVQSKEEYLRLRDSDRQKWLVGEIRRGSKDGSMTKEEIAKKKRQLIQFNYSCIPGEDGRLKGVRTPSMTVGMDIDFDPNDPDYERKMAEVPQRVMEKKDEIGLLMMERSVSKGYHIVFRRMVMDGIAEGRILENQEMNLRKASEIIGCSFDKGARDITRVFFGTTASEGDLIYLDEGLTYSPPNPPEGGCAMPRMEGGGLAAKLPGTVASQEAATEAASLSSPRGGREGAPAAPGASGGSYQGIPYSSILRKYWEMYYDGCEPAEGGRNVLTYEICMQIRAICNYSQELMEKVVPRYDGFPEDEWRRTIVSALKEPRRSMPYRMTQVLKELKKERRLKYLAVGADKGDNENDSNVRGADMPLRPPRMPKFLKLVSSKVPERLKAMVEESIWPAACAHLHGVKFKYIDGCEHEANISSPLIGRQCIGKGNVNKPIEIMLADITARDEESEAREEQWRVNNKGKSMQKDRQQRPTDIVVQRLDFDLTPAALSQALIDVENNGGRRVITKVDEIEMLNQVGNGRNDTVGLLVRYAFDTARWGQKRVGLEAVNGSYTVRWVWNASCTRGSAHSFITKKWVSNGSLSRLNVNTIIAPKGRQEIGVIGEYDDAYCDGIKMYMDRLNAASGLVECRQADKLAKQMLDEHNDIADQCESEGYRIMSYRAVVIGWLKANILYILNNYQWDKSIADYAAYSVRRDLWVKFFHFGDEIAEVFDQEEDDSCHCSIPQNIFAMLPQEFTYKDFLDLRKAQGLAGDGKSTLRSWVHRKALAIDDISGKYVKTKK